MSVVNIFDITADDCGAYSKHSSPSTGVEVDVDDEGVCGSILTTISKQNARSLPGTANKRRFLVKRQYSWHTLSRDYKRIISKVEENGKLLHYAIVQYRVKTANPSSLFERRHGNSKKSQEPYIRTKPSVMKKIRDLEVRSRLLMKFKSKRATLAAFHPPRLWQEIEIKSIIK